jgi:hypothetical protein
MSPSQENSAAASPDRSTFVTVVAWIFIAIAGFATFISLLQAAMFMFVFPADQFPPAGSTKGLEEMPVFFRFMIQNIQWFFVMFWSLSALTFVAAIGLLRRRNWARLIFVGLMAFGILWNLGGIWLQEQMMSSFPKLSANSPADVRTGFETMMTVMRFAMGAFAIGISLLFAWIIKRLMSRSVKAEFNVL